MRSTRPQPPAPDGDQALFGAEVRRRRRDRGLTLVQLAARAEISHPFLSQLERGLARPSMITLARIATALETTQAELMLAAESASTPASADARVVRAQQGRRLPHEPAKSPEAEGSSRLLVHSRAAFYPQEFTEVHTEFGAYFQHDEDEWVYVVDGAIVADLGKLGTTRLDRGDSLYYAGGTPHRWRVVDGPSARLIVVKDAGHEEPS
ncbi:helix-turn-helix domain-containing protein [Nocardia neocaledoniensis]|uniref:helix-turn-helix domain-containing protein n=1 Tax=Nocardia neocaledoniensis TaxID=236511 RepID=UPI0024560130|nr:helix-turn-helix domain-containing protein [Nocardia neocaledoniensis]